MNKFRANLHPAFFVNPESPSSSVESPEARLERELNELKTPILQEFDTSTNNFLDEVNQGKEQRIVSRYTDNEKLKSDHRRFFERIKSEDWKYPKLWNKNIAQGFGSLISALKEAKYFEGKNLKSETEKIKEKYWEEVKQQYINNVWFAGNTKYENIRDNLFGEDSPDYPANKIYCKLTGATTIFRANRTYVEGYYDAESLTGADTKSVDGATTVENEDKEENMSERQNRNFLSNDLPEYLWNIRKTPGGLKLLGALPLFSVKEDRPSLIDRNAIKYLLKYSSKIKLEGNKNKDKTVALMEAFHDNRLRSRSGEQNYKDVLKDHGIVVDDKYIDNIVKAGSFYISTQSETNSAKDQHAIYLSILKIIESEGGVDNAVKKYKAIVEQAEKDKKLEKKEGYENGEKLGSTDKELYEIAKNLGITDFTSATRLSKRVKDNPDCFKDTPVERVLADLDNDGFINARDAITGGSKTGLQFLEIFNQVAKTEAGRKTALNNLVKRAKLVNDTTGVGLQDALFDVKTIESDIKSGHTGLILILQDIISNPREDLYTLLTGAEGEKSNIFEGQDLKQIEAEGKIREEAFNEAGKILREKAFLQDYKDLLKGKDNVNIQNFADLQASLASCLYDNYKLGLGIGSTLSFKDWAKGIQIGTGAQVRGDGVVLGLNISYSKNFDAGKGWTMTPGLSGGVFLPIVSGNKDVFASAGLNFTADKKQLKLDTGTVRHYGFDAGFNVLTDTAYLGRHDTWDKAEGIDEAAKFQSTRFEQVIMWNLLDQIKEKVGNVIDLNKPETKDIIKKMVENQRDIAEEDREKVVNGMIEMLAPYNNMDLNQEGVKYAIAKGVADEYAHEWSEKRKQDVTKNIYRSGYSVGAFWIVGTPNVGVYAETYVTKNDDDGKGDKWGKSRKIEQEYKGELTQKYLDEKFNQELGLSEDKKIRLENGLIVIPASVAHRVNVNKKMEGLMKKDEKGNVYLDTKTPMSLYVKSGGNTQSKEIVIGGESGGKFEKLDALEGQWFTAGDIDQNKVLELGEGVTEYTSDFVNDALQNLKNKFPQGDKIRNYAFENMEELLKQLNAIDKSKGAKITIAEKNGKLARKVEQGNGGRGLEIEYKSKAEMINNEVRGVLESVYAEADKVTCDVLAFMCHHLPGYRDTRWPEYIQFAEAMNKKNYAAAKPLIIGILRNLDTEINKQQKNNPVDFGGVATKIEAMTDEIYLGQVLMSVNNIFARSIKVHGKGQEEINGKQISKYELTVPMGEVIKEREEQIRKTINDNADVKEPGKSGYLALIEASKKYRIANKNKFNIRESKAAQLNNTVGFNLGNGDNPENPLFNPEIYEQTVDMKDLENFGFDDKQRNALHEHAMRLYVKNSALINPVLKALGLEGKTVDEDKIEFKFDDNTKKGKLTLDIGDKKVTLSAGMKFGYFTQCVNHTVILDDISAETEDGTSVTFNSGSWNGKTYTEGVNSTITATVRYGFGGSVIVSKEGGENGGEDNTAVSSNDATTGGPGFETNPSGTEAETPTSPTTAPTTGGQSDSGAGGV